MSREPYLRAAATPLPELGADADVLIGGPQRLVDGLEDRLKGRVVDRSPGLKGSAPREGESTVCRGNSRSELCFLSGWRGEAHGGT